MSATRERVKRHRDRLAGTLKRVEVVVPAEDTQRLRRLAAVLRRDDPRRNTLRREIDARTAPDAERNGLALFPFLDDTSLEEVEIELPDRKTMTFTPVDLSEE